MGFVSLLARVLGLLRPERTLAIVLALSNVAIAALQFCEPVLFGDLINLLVGADGRPGAALWPEASKLLALWAVVGVGGLIASVVVSLYANRMAHRGRLAAMAGFLDHVLMLPVAFHHAQHSSRLLKIMLVGVDRLFAIWASFFRQALATFVALFVMLPLSLLINWPLGLLLLILMLFFTGANVWVMRHTDQLQRRIEDYRTRIASRAGDALGNVHLVQSFGRLKGETGELQRIMRQMLDAQFPVLSWWALLSVATRLVSTITLILIFVLGTWLYTHGAATVGEIACFMGFANIVIARMEHAAGFIGGIFFHTASLADFFRVLDTASTVRDRPGARELGRAKGRVEFDDVSFSYDGRRPALSHFSLTVEAGSMVALVGATGAGKSTTLSLLHRMWEPQSGTIRIDGVDYREIKLASLRHNIGVVFQDSTLLRRSIADNLRIGKPDASDAELERAARLAEAHDFIVDQARGYETLVGERGATLSGGERQRLSIARALLKDPPILILDEATSALDSMTEARVQKALRTLMHGRTTFVIAHRLSTIRDADRIVVLDHGRIVEQGGFAELVARGGAFSRFVAAQRAGAVSEPESSVSGSALPHRFQPAT
ncbi:MAG: glucan ABC transporter ATP-binding protein/ permease [Proteobacteria bacterium]|nr:glucan ABC transporter ATP-binding protein/ permease [Pseudomonadota bacterium]